MSEGAREWLVEDRSESALWQLNQATYEWANLHIEESDRVLDYGCGSGYGTSAFSGQAVGVDVSDEALTFARSNHPGIEFRKIESRLPFPEDCFDVICSFQVIEHVDPLPYLNEAARVLKPDGILLLVTPPRESRLFPWQRPWNPHHLTEYTEEQLLDLVDTNFGEVRYLPMVATGEIADLESARWRKNKFLSVPMTVPIMPDSWRRSVLLEVSRRVSKTAFSADTPNGEVAVGGSGRLMNHCVIARQPRPLPA